MILLLNSAKRNEIFQVALVITIQKFSRHQIHRLTYIIFEFRNNYFYG